MAMIDIPAGGILRCTVVQRLANQILLNTWHYSPREGAVNDVNEQTLADAFMDTVLDPLKDVQSEDVTYFEVQLQVIHPERLVVYSSIPSVAAGTVVGDAVPPTVAVVARRRTSKAGRDQQGRVFIGGVALTDVAAGRLTDAARQSARWGNMFAAMTATWVAGVGIMEPVIVSQDATGYIIRGVVKSTFIDQDLRSQRRREVGRGI